MVPSGPEPWTPLIAGDDAGRGVDHGLRRDQAKPEPPSEIRTFGPMVTGCAASS